METAQHLSPATARPLAKLVAVALVFFCSFVVMVLEIFGTRLLAPYVGVTLQVYTAIIGTVLAGISVGTWLGGQLADRLRPRLLLVETLILAGAAILATVPLVRWLGPHFRFSNLRDVTLLPVLTLFLPVACLSVVNPTVVKLQLGDLTRTGRTIGLLSAISTAGAIIGTFGTGFVLAATFPLTPVIVSSGLAVLIVAILLILQEVIGRSKVILIALIVVIGSTGGTISAIAKTPCGVESSYYCIRVFEYQGDPNKRILMLDDLEHAVVDVTNPRYLGFSYTQLVGSVVDHKWPKSQPIHSLAIGGGGFTMPKYIDATRPESSNEVFEIDPEIVKIAKQQLALVETPQLKVRIGDARTRLNAEPSGSYDMIFGDAFGGESAPWQLTTTEFDSQIARVLNDNGAYVMNVIDYKPFKFVRAELQTLRKSFPYVGVFYQYDSSDAVVGANLELIALKSTPSPSVVEQWASEGWRLKDGAALDAFIGSSQVLRDEFAPVDQLKTNSRKF